MVMMSNSIMRRVFISCRKLSLISSHCQYIPSSTPITHSGPAFLFQLSRGFANTQNTDEHRGTFRAVDFGNAIKSVALSQMEAAAEALKRDLAKISTGVADRIFVVIKGKKIPLSKMTAVSLWQPKHHHFWRSYSIVPYDPETTKKLEKAIVASPFDMSVRVDGKDLIAYFPPSTHAKQRKAFHKLVIKYREHARHGIRRVKLKALETMEKEKERTGFSIPDFSAGYVKKLEKEIDEMTKKYVKSIEEMTKKYLKSTEEMWITEIWS